MSFKVEIQAPEEPGKFNIAYQLREKFSIGEVIKIPIIVTEPPIE